MGYDSNKISYCYGCYNLNQSYEYGWEYTSA